MSIFKHSRYVHTPRIPAITSDGEIIVSTLGLRDVDVRPSPTDETHIFKRGDRLDLISYRYYGDSQLGWAILDANLLFSELDINYGDILTIPSIHNIPR